MYSTGTLQILRGNIRVSINCHFFSFILCIIIFHRNSEDFPTSRNEAYNVFSQSKQKVGRGEDDDDYDIVRRFTSSQRFAAREGEGGRDNGYMIPNLHPSTFSQPNTTTTTTTTPAADADADAADNADAATAGESFYEQI